MPRSDDSLERLRAAIDELAADDAADLLTEARIEARARVRATLTDALAHSMLERLHDQLDVPAPAEPRRHAPAGPAPPPRTRAPAAARRPPEPSGETAWYVYGVVRADAELSGELRGVNPAGPVTILREDALAAVTSQVPLDEFAEERLRAHLADMAWVEATARAHESVLERICEQATVIPMRMCTVYRTEGGISEMLRRESTALRDALDHLEGKAEWGVKVFTDFARADGRIQAVDAGAGESPGAAYMEQRRTERERREHAMELAEEAAARVHERLSATAADAHVIPLQRREVSGHDGDMILNGVYLVTDELADAFHDEVRELRFELEAAGIDVMSTGPWPPYNFVPGTIGAGW